MDAVNAPVPPEASATWVVLVPPIVGAELVEVMEYTNPRAETVAPPSLLTVPLNVAVPAVDPTVAEFETVGADKVPEPVKATSTLLIRIWSAFVSVVF